jgi:hypothetical protein
MRRALVVVALCACGPTDSSHSSSGSSGIAGERPLSGLTPTEAVALCDELAADFPARTVSCDGETFRVGVPAADCASEPVAPGTCTATVSDMRDCFETYYNTSDSELCTSGALPEECDPLLSGDCPI